MIIFVQSQSVYGWVISSAAHHEFVHGHPLSPHCKGLVVLLRSSDGAAAQPRECVCSPAATAARTHPPGASASALGGQYGFSCFSYCPPIGGQCQHSIIIRTPIYY